MIFEGNILGKSSFNNKTSYCCKNSYEKHIRKAKEDFSVGEYEIFQIINE